MIVVRDVCGLVQYVNEWSYCLAGVCSVLLHAYKKGRRQIL